MIVADDTNSTIGKKLSTGLTQFIKLLCIRMINDDNDTNRSINYTGDTLT